MLLRHAMLMRWARARYWQTRVLRTKTASGKNLVVKNCVGEIASLKAMSRLGLVDSSTAGVSECAVALNVIVATAGGAAAGALAGGSQGALAGAGASSNNERFNRQLHEPEKTKAQQIAATAKAQGLTNADGSPITAAQIENAMRGASNSQ